MAFLNFIIFIMFWINSLQETPNVNKNLFEGDIMGIDSDTVLRLVSAKNRELSGISVSGGAIEHGAAIGDPSAMWPEGKVYYEISDEFTSAEIAVIESAFDSFHQHTCIKLIKRSHQEDYIHIIKGFGCWSCVGRSGGLQYLSLAENCLKENGKGLAIHEIMHAIGFFHEQSRWDRDDHVKILWSNIINETDITKNFMKYGLDVLQNLRTDYDYDSIMHYESASFGINGSQTIIPKRRGIKLGQRNRLSEIDIKEINLLYKCIANQSYTATFRDTSNDKIRWGIRFSRHYFAIFVRNPDECIERCKQLPSCQAVTFETDTGSNDNCYFFNSAQEYNYTINLDLTKRYGTWEKIKKALDYLEEYKICWGTRFITHSSSFHAQNPDECVKNCKQNAQCLAITFYHDSTFTHDNCYLFNSNNYITKFESEMQYGVWKKDTSYVCKYQSDIEWGRRFMRHYLGLRTRTPNDCIQKCKEDSSCDAITFNKGVANFDFNCFCFNSAYRYDTLIDPSMLWGIWLKDKTAQRSRQPNQPIEWGLRLKKHYSSYNVRNVAQCKRLCEQEAKCNAMSFEICVNDDDINCYFFNSADNYVSETDSSHKWATWKKRENKKGFHFV